MKNLPLEHRYDGEGIECGYRNDKWVVGLKNWTPGNDLAGLRHLEIHHQSDEQFILIRGKAALITATPGEDGPDMELTRLEPVVLYTVPRENWFFTILQRDTRMMIVQDADCTADNSEYRDLNAKELLWLHSHAAPLFA